jgi:5-methylcytosine-specific restriction endonuclease McrA
VNQPRRDADGNIRRIRGRRLQQIRDSWLYDHPLCVHCLQRGRTAAATQLDHIVALANGGKDFDADDGKNRQGLCDECHELKTAADLGYTHKPKRVIGLDGFPIHTPDSSAP